MTLWLHEYFAVNGSKAKGAAKRDVDIYQAVEFSTAGELPLAVRQGLSDKDLSQIWVKGVYLAPAARIRRANPDLPKDRYIFQKDTEAEWKPAIQYKAELGNSPELVMVTDCTMWHPISDVLHMLPRVVHPYDVQTHRVYVNGRDWHYVCGVTATELPYTSDRKRRPTSTVNKSCGFALTMVDRKLFSMYPEEKLGGLINSSSLLWENVDELFQGIRKVMSFGTGCVSGSFLLPWTNACQRFWEVRCIFLQFCTHLKTIANRFFSRN